jgi:hypothetical protein
MPPLGPSPIATPSNVANPSLGIDCTSVEGWFRKAGGRPDERLATAWCVRRDSRWRHHAASAVDTRYSHSALSEHYPRCSPMPCPLAGNLDGKCPGPIAGDGNVRPTHTLRIGEPSSLTGFHLPHAYRALLLVCYSAPSRRLLRPMPLPRLCYTAWSKAAHETRPL